jgi:hypothetical protein
MATLLTAMQHNPMKNDASAHLEVLSQVNLGTEQGILQQSNIAL